jgi:ABC-type branched-subunit amino acid transport system substrate-binding protein
MVFAVAAPYETRADIRTKIAKEDFGIRSMAIIQDILPGVNPAPIEKGWRDAARKHGVEITSYVNIDSTASDCSSEMLGAIRGRPEYMMLPIAAGPMLACMRTAATQQVGIGKAGSPQLKNWSGGSNLQFEVDQCGQQCHGMYSGGTPFLDPRSNPSPAAKKYIENMARYAPGIDVTGFITINYYHAGLLQYEVIKKAGPKTLSRENVIKAAENFGPFETGFGNTVQWTSSIPRVPTTCGYRVKLDPAQKKWVFDNRKVCV